MAEPLKNFFSPALVKRLACEVGRVYPAFDAAAFIREATRGMESLELMDRGKHLARALSKHLPEAYPRALDILLRSTRGSAEAGDGKPSSMAPFFFLPHVTFVAERGLEHFELSMQAQHELTKRFTAEFSMRPFLARDPERTLEVLREWTADGDERVRRLVSECTRTRLPWAPRVGWLDANPERVLALLERLKDDPSEFVRRSVANNLNDLFKDHPALMLATCGRWLEDASAERRRLVEHALRSAVKRGDAEALGLLGFGGKPAVVVESVAIAPRRVRIGERVELRFGLRSTSRKPQALLVDLAVHFVKASGKASPKVFKLDRVQLGPGEAEGLKTRISLAEHTTRKPRPGVHRLEVLVNGARYPAGEFEVITGRVAGRASREPPAKGTEARSPRATSRASHR